MDLGSLYRRTIECWASRVNDVAADQWDQATPCAEWTVRDLVNHVAAEDLWTVPLVHGHTIDEVGDRFDGDVLGDDPIATALRAAGEAESAVLTALPKGGKVHLSYGEEKLGEYVHQLAADHLIHAWDLAAATGGDTRMDPATVTEVARWFSQREAIFRSAGLISERAPLTGDPQADLLAGYGRRAGWGRTDAALAAFSAAFGRGDVDAIMSLMTEDCVFESTSPPDGERHEGTAAIRQVWEELFTGTADASFSEEASFVSGDRAVLRWRFDWTDADGGPGHVRGVDLLRFRDGRVAEKLSYVKG